MFSQRIAFAAIFYTALYPYKHFFAQFCKHLNIDRRTHILYPIHTHVHLIMTNRLQHAQKLDNMTNRQHAVVVDAVDSLLLCRYGYSLHSVSVFTYPSSHHRVQIPTICVRGYTMMLSVYTTRFARRHDASTRVRLISIVRYGDIILTTNLHYIEQLYTSNYAAINQPSNGINYHN